MIAPDPDSTSCRGINEVLQRIGDKWSMLLISRLAGGPKRFNQLKREIPSISQRMLTLTLRGLERDGLVSRTVTPSIPPRVDYELTELGSSLEAPVNALARWAIDNIATIHEAQAQFDADREESRAA